MINPFAPENTKIYQEIAEEFHYSNIYDDARTKAEHLHNIDKLLKLINDRHDMIFHFDSNLSERNKLIFTTILHFWETEMESIIYVTPDFLTGCHVEIIPMDDSKLDKDRLELERIHFEGIFNDFLEDLEDEDD